MLLGRVPAADGSVRFLLKVIRAQPFTDSVQASSVGSSGPLAQQIQLEAARGRMLNKQIDAQGQQALQLIQSAMPTNTTPEVGTILDIVA